MPASLTRILSAGALLALAACAGPSDNIPPSNAPALAPGTPVVTTVPPPAIATPPVAAAPVVPTAPVPAAARLTATEITGLVSGNTLTGVATNGQPYSVWISPGGQLRFRQGSFVDSGTWRIGPDGRFCTTMQRTSNGREECYFLYRTTTPQAVRFDRVDGGTAGTFSVLPGNAHTL